MSEQSIGGINRVRITCPSTGEAVDTVLRLRSAAFESLKGEYRFRCSKCGEIHAWSRTDAWLEGVGPRDM